MDFTITNLDIGAGAFRVTPEDCEAMLRAFFGFPLYPPQTQPSDRPGIDRMAAQRAAMDAIATEHCPASGYTPSRTKPPISGLTSVHTGDHRLGAWW